MPIYYPLLLIKEGLKMGVSREVHLRGFKNAESFQRNALKPSEELTADVPNNGYIAGIRTYSVIDFDRELAVLNKRTRFVAFALVTIDEAANAIIVYTKSSKKARRFWG